MYNNLAKVEDYIFSSIIQFASSGFSPGDAARLHSVGTDSLLISLKSCGSVCPPYAAVVVSVAGAAVPAAAAATSALTSAHRVSRNPPRSKLFMGTRP